MTFDPTINRIPFGLLSEDEQTALIHWPHGWEYYWDGWCPIQYPEWVSDSVYRGKPAPVVKTVWSPIYNSGGTGFSYASYQAAIDAADKSIDLIGVLRVDIANGVPSVCVEKLRGPETGEAPF